MGMTKKEVEEFKALLRKQREEVNSSKEAAEKLLIKLGVLMPDGTLSEPFKELERYHVPR